LLTAGVDLKTTSMVLGHASPTTTLGIYAHVLDGSTRDAVDRLGERLTNMAGRKPS
jgi:site-specific recombinase XerD